jgi:hypothetical protein
MRTLREPSRQTPVVAEVDVLVVGGGPGGWAAAVAAGRLGARVMLVDRYGCLGGLATGGLVLHLMAMFDRAGDRWIGGLAWETVERLSALGGLAWEGPTRPHADSEVLKVVMDELCAEAGVTLRLHSWAVDCVVEEGRFRGAILESKSGRQAVVARVCIDATGDGDLAAQAGAGYDTHTMAIGLPLKLGGIDLPAYRKFAEAYPERAGELAVQVKAAGGYPIRPRPTPYSDSGVYWVNISGVARRAGAGAESNSVRDLEGKLETTNVEDLTYAEVELRRRTFASVRFYRENVPGFENVQLLGFASQIGVRDSRHIHGLHTLTRPEVEAGTSFPDAVGAAAVGFSQAGHTQIPYGCLVPRDLEGLLLAGRCVSVDDWIIESVRLIPPAMVTGQAAGTAAALAARERVPVADLDPEGIRDRLRAEGVILDRPIAAGAASSMAGVSAGV